MNRIQILFNLNTFLHDLNIKINNFISNYTNEPLFWIAISGGLFVITYLWLKQSGKK